METISLQELQRCLEEVLDCGAFELRFTGTDCAIPYMINDAVECILLLRNCRMTGQWQAELPAPSRAEFIEEPQPGIIFRQGTENVFTLWYRCACRRISLFRYDQIGHFWVSGQEQWRRLTYIIGTMHDKYEYLGAGACSDLELELLPLIGFRPFRMYSPIEDTLDGRYCERADAARLMSDLAREAGDRNFARWSALYARLPLRLLAAGLGAYLATERASKLYAHIYKKAMAAAGGWPDRDYGREENARIRAMRRAAQEHLAALGFSGIYPLFSRGDIQVLAAEEHPFTEFESEDFRFTIRYMVSVSPRHSVCAGFFSGEKNRSFIACSLDDFTRFLQPSPAEQKKSLGEFSAAARKET